MTPQTTPMDQPPPIPNDRPAVWDAVAEYMRARDLVGLGTYGVRLTAFNGRDPLRDLLDEQLDACAYTMQAIQERDAARARIAELEAEVRSLESVVHPWYGPCDGLGPNGACSECGQVLVLRRPAGPSVPLKHPIDRSKVF